MNRRIRTFVSAVTIAVGGMILLNPKTALAGEGQNCCTSANKQAQCCGWHCEATLTTCDACTGFWNCLLT